ncbi:dienelactone hydrolase family protein [Ensifer sp. HO-A22]|uniref:Dienelactone hydrolase family protein n=1 Tax=Ensifer oleiphilus TaxID=2742698 RepID=A0A7Y6Q4A5_9HYPH|nr:dienelactone hydrolase family protein [Ensifer oleiphilus]NVD38827.1 dienelactone hydrolase family protein [Ensifer oleiphilus]
MATVILFHSIRGLRALERDAATRLQALGHHVLTPDLFDGQVAGSVDEGFALKDRIGWRTLCERAEAVVAGQPASAVLGGFSFGAAVASHLWAKRPETSGVLLLHSIVGIPENARDGVPVQLHLADPDIYEPAEDVAAWRALADRSPIALEAFSYPGVGHLYTDASLPDFDAEAASLTWGRVERFLGAL